MCEVDFLVISPDAWQAKDTFELTAHTTLVDSPLREHAFVLNFFPDGADDHALPVDQLWFAAHWCFT